MFVVKNHLNKKGSTPAKESIEAGWKKLAIV